MMKSIATLLTVLLGLGATMALAGNHEILYGGPNASGQSIRPSDSTFRLQGATSTAGVPDLSESTASSAYTGPGSVVLFNRPDGGGLLLTAARNLTGTHDATVTLTLRDALGAPIANYPAEDLWLEAADGGLAFCTGGTTADANADASGTTTWASPLRAGGSSQAPTIVMISGMELPNGGLPINHNSVDLNGDGLVNLSDVAFFAGDFYGVYAFRSDFHFDGAVDLADVSMLAQAYGVQCP